MPYCIVSAVVRDFDGDSQFRRVLPRMRRGQTLPLFIRQPHPASERKPGQMTLRVAKIQILPDMFQGKLEVDPSPALLQPVSQALVNDTQVLLGLFATSQLLLPVLTDLWKTEVIVRVKIFAAHPKLLIALQE